MSRFGCARREGLDGMKKRQRRELLLMGRGRGGEKCAGNGCGEGRGWWGETDDDGQNKYFGDVADLNRQAATEGT
jgi:hypothetical protein